MRSTRRKCRKESFTPNLLHISAEIHYDTNEYGVPPPAWPLAPLQLDTQDSCQRPGDGLHCCLREAPQSPHKPLLSY
jgi:hypothetical protein